uniref:uncharacterized protein LOC120330740 n=1 Tax=Styela clava TaxID=7725 RepID=UPI001939B536|nr:uncharacterized protein LOC120330740 [Styela clava]
MKIVLLTVILLIIAEWEVESFTLSNKQALHDSRYLLSRVKRKFGNRDTGIKKNTYLDDSNEIDNEDRKERDVNDPYRKDALLLIRDLRKLYGMHQGSNDEKDNEMENDKLKSAMKRILLTSSQYRSNARSYTDKLTNEYEGMGFDNNLAVALGNLERKMSPKKEA